MESQGLRFGFELREVARRAIIKNCLSVAAITVGLCLIPGPTQAEVKISIKIQGGPTYLQAGDVNPGTRAFFDWVKSSLVLPNTGWKQGGYEPLHYGYEFYGDLVFMLNQTIGICIGAGYMRGYKTSGGGLDNRHGATGGVTAKSKLSAIPFRLGLCLTLPLTRRIGFFANAGASYYYKARYSADWRIGEFVMDTIVYEVHVSTSAEKKANPFGFQGGLGIEYRPFQGISLFIEGQGNYARFQGLEGVSMVQKQSLPDNVPEIFSEKGKLYYAPVSILEGAPRLIMVRSVPPGREAQEAIVDFSRISLQAGIRIRFGE